MESKERYYRLIENAPVAISVTTAEGEIIEVNKALLEMRGYESREELINTPLLSAMST